jgi:predicted TIM-barrel fold metal-dependent hydrolase
MIDTIARLDIDERVRQKIYGENAATLLGLS